MIKLKKLNEQVIVITGASSGIGLVTARGAAKQGAKTVLVARSEEPLKKHAIGAGFRLAALLRGAMAEATGQRPSQENKPGSSLKDSFSKL